jgi:transcriptional regulator with XRE-family HTH domain
MTLKEVGEELDPPVSAAYVSDVELGRRPPTAERLPQFAKALRMGPDTVRELYRRAGLFPDGLSERLGKAPEIWDANFKSLVDTLPKAILALRDTQPELAAQLEKAAKLTSPREKASTR